MYLEKFNDKLSKQKEKVLSDNETKRKHVSIMLIRK